MTIYVDRLKNLFATNEYYSWTIGGKIRTPWIGNKRVDAPVEITMKEITYHEEEYKGFQIVIVGRKCDRRTMLDQNGNRFSNDGSVIQDQDIGGYEDAVEVTTTYGYAYEITENPKQKVEWLDDDVVVSGIGRADNDINKTIKITKKKLDLISLVRDVRQDLISLSSVRFPHTTGSRSDYVPYNALIGDQVFIQAHGRLRKGIVVATTGSRFVVGYMTPSNSKDLKYKILPLMQLMKEKVA